MKCLLLLCIFSIAGCLTAEPRKDDRHVLELYYSTINTNAKTLACLNAINPKEPLLEKRGKVINCLITRSDELSEAIAQFLRTVGDKK